MKFVQIAMVTLLASIGVQAQSSTDPGPSPTESTGCEPHGDHWHCEASLTSMSGSTAIEASILTTLPPSPTNSQGCEPHGDHWHCDGPASSDAGVSNLSSDAATITSAIDGSASSAAASITAPETSLNAGVKVMVPGLAVGLLAFLA